MRTKPRPALRWALFWLVILSLYAAASLFFGSFAFFVPVPALAGVYFLLRLALSVPISRVKRARLRRGLTGLALLLSLALTLSLGRAAVTLGYRGMDRYIASLDYSVFSKKPPASYDRETGVYTLRAEGEQLTVLQLTDIHLCGSLTTAGVDRQAIDACYALIREAQPDLIVVTGDLIYAVPYLTFSSNNLKPIYQLCDFFNRVGIPWAMTYGNHDTQAVSDYDVASLEGLFRYFRNQPGCPMLYARVQPDIYGRYNQYLRLENADGSLNRLLFLLDSNDYLPGSVKINDYDSIHPDQIQWYADTIDRVSAEEGAPVRSFVFLHIPLREYADAAAALAAGDPEAVRLFGENQEPVSAPDRNSGFFDVILEKGSTDAVFAGHDHLNGLGLRYKGVDLIYGKSIDCIAYPGIAKKTAQRGGTLIHIQPDGYRIEPLPYDP